jgi:tetratricopeptide (TPR) repeat protein
MTELPALARVVPSFFSRLFLFLGCIFLLVSDVSVAQAAGRPAELAHARTRLLKGNYAEARDEYRKVAKDQPKLAADAAMGIAQSYWHTDDTAEALTTLDEALKASPKHAGLLAYRAEYRYQLGRWDEAEQDADAAIQVEEFQLRARWVKARILRDRGKVPEADQMFRSVVRYYSKRSNDDDDIKDAEDLIIVAECGAENARWHNLPRQFSFILNEVIADALKNEKNYWPAELLAGQMLLEKYNRPDALEAFDKALALNPNVPEALVGKAEAARVKFELKDAEQFADQALKIRPKLPAALRLKADILIQAGDFPAAEGFLKQAELVNPRDSRTLGKLAGLYWLTQRKPAFEALAKRVETFDAKPGEFYHEFAAVLDERKQFAPAEQYYKKAAELRTLMSAPRTALGMLQLRMGNEVEARKLLDAAFKLDPFNVRVANSRKVLDHLSTYETLQTAHYDLRFDPKSDKLLAEFLAEFLEATHAEFKQQFGFEPTERTLVEVFNSHDMFSGRTIGLPDLHTIGACTGRVIAMASPQAKGIPKPFNWARVIRHELTHIFNLAQTDFQCPHWLTEGLAVRNEQMNRPPLWSQILRKRFLANDLLNLDTILLAFVRPRSQEEWTLAYCQSQLYVEYLIEQHGIDAVGKVLSGYRTSADTATVLKAALNVDKEVFEAGYREHLKKVVDAVRSPAELAAEKVLTFPELVAAVEKSPEDFDLKARLAEGQFRRNNLAEAKKLTDEVLEKKPGQPVATLVRVKLLARGGDDEGAKAALLTAIKANPDDPRLMLQAGRIYLDEREFEKAAEFLEKGRGLAPLDGNWLELLTRCYEGSKNSEKLIAILQEIVGQDPDELAGRVKLAQLFVSAQKPAEAERFARDALAIDVHDAEARKQLLAALEQQGKTDAAAKLRARFMK